MSCLVFEWGSWPGARWASSGDKIALCIFSLSVLLFLFSSPFAVLLNCLFPNPQVLPFSSSSPPHSNPSRMRRSGKMGRMGRSERATVVLCCRLELNHDKRRGFLALKSALLHIILKMGTPWQSISGRRKKHLWWQSK